MTRVVILKFDEDLGDGKIVFPGALTYRDQIPITLGFRSDRIIGMATDVREENGVLTAEVDINPELLDPKFLEELTPRVSINNVEFSETEIIGGRIQEVSYIDETPPSFPHSPEVPKKIFMEDFLLARFAEAELICEGSTYLSGFQKLIDMGRHVVELHRTWPVLLEAPLEMDLSKYDPNNLDEIRIAFMQKMEFRTREAYFELYGEEGPAAPFLKSMLMSYQEHPDFNPDWIK